MRPLFAVACALFAAGCQTQIQHGLDERTASELQTVLIERGFEAEKVLEPGKKPTWGIQVSDDRATDATRVLSELGLPRPATRGFSEVFSRGSLVPSPTEERAGAEIAITVRNNLVVPSPLTVRIRPEIAGGLQILGNVSPGREQTFRYNPQVVRGNYRLTARATGGGDITSTPFQLQGVSEVRWNVQQNSLQVLTN